MKREKFEKKRADLTKQVLARYHFVTGANIMRDRHFIAHRSERLAQLHYDFGCLAIAYVPAGGEVDYLRRLKRVRNELKIQYIKMKGGKLYERIKQIFRLGKIYGRKSLDRHFYQKLGRL